MPDLRRLILLPVVWALAALLLAAAPASAESFSNPTPIKIPASGTGPGPASPYPSQVTVGGMSGPINDVNVTLHRVGGRAWDIKILLVSPSGDTVNLMGGNCGDVDIEDYLVTLDQQAATPMPGSSTADNGCSEFFYRPNP